MNKQIKNAYENGQLVLCLGAGCSLTSKDQFNNSLLSARELSEKIASKAGWKYSGEPLSSVYSAALNVLGDSLYNYLEELYKHCKPSKEYQTIAQYVWPRIYTLNIDDALDKALMNSKVQKVNIRNRIDKVVDQDQILNNLDLIKLNGSIDRIDLGFIFSANEYGEASSKSPFWYRELAADFFRYTFLFIGTKLNEPVFYHQISRYRADSGSIDRRSYVLTPSATPIEKSNLDTINLEHINGSLNDFSKWLVKSFPKPPSKIDIACNRNPALKEIFSKSSSKAKESYTSIFDDVTLVSRKYIKGQLYSTLGHSKVRNFYRGFKPDWSDIVDGIPAEIGATRSLYEKVKSNLLKDSNLIVVYGPAGSGKTTLLKQVSLLLYDKDDIACYFLERPTSNFNELIKELEKIHVSGGGP